MLIVCFLACSRNALRYAITCPSTVRLLISRSFGSGAPGRSPPGRSPCWCCRRTQAFTALMRLRRRWSHVASSACIGHNISSKTILSKTITRWGKSFACGLARFTGRTSTTSVFGSSMITTTRPKSSLKPTTAPAFPLKATLFTRPVSLMRSPQAKSLPSLSAKPPPQLQPPLGGVVYAAAAAAAAVGAECVAGLASYRALRKCVLRR